MKRNWGIKADFIGIMALAVCLSACGKSNETVAVTEVAETETATETEIETETETEIETEIETETETEIETETETETTTAEEEEQDAAVIEKPIKEEHEHTYTAATCTQPATCTICGAVSGTTVAHSYAAVNQYSDASYDYTVYSCSFCGDSYTDMQEIVVQVDLSPATVYNAMIAYQSIYPEGTTWTNDNYYPWNGGIYSGGYGCSGFAFMLSDAAFGSLPARQTTDTSNIRVGDILRVENNTHSVIVLAVNGDILTLAEGNYNSSVHWGRTFSISENAADITYVMTRYPQ